MKLQTLQWLRFHCKILIADQRGGENSDSDSDDPEVVQNALKEITPAFDVESDEAHLDVTLEEEITFLRQYREMIMTKNQWEKRVWVEFYRFDLTLLQKQTLGKKDKVWYLFELSQVYVVSLCDSL